MSFDAMVTHEWPDPRFIVLYRVAEERRWLGIRRAPAQLPTRRSLSYAEAVLQLYGHSWSMTIFSGNWLLHTDGQFLAFLFPIRTWICLRLSWAIDFNPKDRAPYFSETMVRPLWYDKTEGLGPNNIFEFCCSVFLASVLFPYDDPLDKAFFYYRSLAPSVFLLRVVAEVLSVRGEQGETSTWPGWYLVNIYIRYILKIHFGKTTSLTLVPIL